LTRVSDAGGALTTSHEPRSSGTKESWHVWRSCSRTADRSHSRSGMERQLVGRYRLAVTSLDDGVVRLLGVNGARALAWCRSVRVSPVSTAR
jgi:hypothetical protein